MAKKDFCKDMLRGMAQMEEDKRLLLEKTAKAIENRDFSNGQEIKDAWYKLAKNYRSGFEITLTNNPSGRKLEGYAGGSVYLNIRDYLKVRGGKIIHVNDVTGDGHIVVGFECETDNVVLQGYNKSDHKVFYTRITPSLFVATYMRD